MKLWVRMFGAAILGTALFSACTSTAPAPLPVPPGGGTPVNPLESHYEQAPDAATCQPGVLKASSKIAVLEAVNRLRALHGLPAVIYDSAHDSATQSAALMMLANNKLSHFPSSDWLCYSPAGAEAAGYTNLSRGQIVGEVSNLSLAQPTAMLGRFMTEINSRNAAGEIKIGHRRWLLNPFLLRIAVGWADGKSPNEYRYAGTLRVIDAADFTIPISSAAEFVAYPYGDYPSEAFDPATRLSFSVLVDKSSLWNNDANRVDFSGARVEMTPALNVSALEFSVLNTRDPNSPGTEGLPNVLEWNAPGMQRGVEYNVKVTGVRIKQGGAWQAREYGYKFKGL